MLANSTKTRALIYFTAFILIDQLTKFYFHSVLKIASINQDLAFSVKFLNPLMLNLVVLILFATVIGVYYRQRLTDVPVIMIFAGALSNIVDRIFRGGVVDFIDLKIWPSFNVADSLIFIGSILLIVGLIKEN